MNFGQHQPADWLLAKGTRREHAWALGVAVAFAMIPASANGAGHVLFVATQSLAGNRLGEVAVPIAVGALTPLPRLAPMP
jgi:hypothetical protein